MLPHLSGHLSSAVLLVVSVTVALATNRLATDSRSVSVVGADSVAPFVTPFSGQPLLPRYRISIPVDPFGPSRSIPVDLGVAPDPAIPTVPSAPVGGRRLTAILIADERRIAVVDDAAVKIGDVLRDGARVAAIQPNRVWVVEKSGRWSVLTLTARGQ